VYKAVHRDSGEEILTLSPFWRGKIKELRPLDREDLLLCQGCRQAVRLKAGAHKRPHFAHKHLQGCAIGDESARLLGARAVVYDWLSAQFPGQVDAEWSPAELDLPRPADCRVRLDEGGFVAWIVDTTLKLEIRQRIQAALSKAGTSVCWLLLSNLLRPDPNHPAWLLLSPTERDFLVQTPYDEIGRENRLLASEFGSTLHYLDVERESLLTFRSLERVHAPNVFAGRREEAALAQVSILPEGQIVYAGEERSLNASRVARARQTERVQRWLEPSTRRTAPQPEMLREQPRAAGEPAVLTQHEVVTCIYCGERTTDWWTAWTEDGERLGKCRTCLDRGLG
jgi:hypothetical protein